MPDDAPDHDFLRYLICDLPLGYPLKTPVSRLLVPTAPMSSRRELLHQQSRFLDLAKESLATHPWIAYLAAAKHEAVLIAIPTHGSQLVDVVDIAFFGDLEQKCQGLRAAARAAIDDTTAHYCDRLIRLQTEAPLIEDAVKCVSGAIKAGFTAVEPLPPSVPEPVPERGSLRYFIGGGVACVVLGALFPPSWGVLIAVLTGVALVAGIGTVVVRKENAKEQARLAPLKAQLKANLLHEQYHTLCRKSVALVLALPFEARQSALVDLPSCLAALEALPPEREALEAAYIRPFVP